MKPIAPFFLLFFLSNALAQIWIQGTVQKITDGDTFHLLSGGQTVKVRLYGIDAPEKKQEHGTVATEALRQLCSQQNVKVKVHNTDRYGRSVGELWLNDTLHVNLWMLQQGHAWWYQAYAKKRPDFEEAQLKAQSERVGLWADKNPLPPWEWRSLQKSQKQKSKKQKKKARS